MPGTPRNTRKGQYNLGAKEFLVDLTVPSGALCQVRRPGPVGLIKAGLLDDMDILGSIVQTDHVDRAEGRAPSSQEDEKTKQLRQAQELMQDKDKLLKATSIIEGVVCHCVVQPEIRMVPLDTERDPEAVYVDSVDFEDQVFIFQYVMGGTADLESFRTEFGEAVGSLAAQQGVPNPAKPAV